MQTRALYGIIVILIALLVLTSSLALFYSYQTQQLKKDNGQLQNELRNAEPKLLSNILIDFGNGTYRWFNDTAIQPGWNFYIATLVVTNGDVNATYYPSIGGGEHYIFGIDGVVNNNARNEYWFLWTWNSTSSWQVAQVGADDLMMYNGSVYGWTYCAENTANYMPECTPP